MTSQEIHDILVSQFGDSILEFSDEPLAEFIIVNSKDWYQIAQFLHDDERLAFDSLMNLSGVDFGKKGDQMEVVYNLFSMSHRHKINIKIQGPREDFSVPSVESVWRMADWFERETFDMYGIIFEGHRNLKRLLLPDDWEGFPLKKDYEVQEYYHGIRVPKIKPKKLN